MLEVINGTIRETNHNAMVQTGGAGGSLNAGTASGGGSGCITTGQFSLTGASSGHWLYQDYWQSYPVYICSDKTKKAIEVLKALQAEKILKCESVPRFIELVEKISNLL